MLVEVRKFLQEVQEVPLHVVAQTVRLQRLDDCLRSRRHTTEPSPSTGGSEPLLTCRDRELEILLDSGHEVPAAPEGSEFDNSMVNRVAEILDDISGIQGRSSGRLLIRDYDDLFEAGLRVYLCVNSIRVLTPPPLQDILESIQVLLRPEVLQDRTSGSHGCTLP